MKIIVYAAMLIVMLAALVFAAGQLGWLAGQEPNGLGARDGHLRPPSDTPNSVSSQAGAYPEHPQRTYAAIEPLRFAGEGRAAMLRLAAVLESRPGCKVIKFQPGTGYLYAQCRTRWMKFTDDLEFLLDASAGAIQVRSASRVGRDDFGANRRRIELIRQQFESAAA